MSKNAELEPLTSIVRVWDDGGKYGDPYEWVATVRHITPEECEVMGYTKPITPDIYKAILHTLFEKGIKKVLITTFPNGSSGVKHQRWVCTRSKVQEFYSHG